MKKFVLAALALIATVGAASAQTANNASDPVHADRNGIYIGGNVGSSIDDRSRINGGFVAGYQVMPFARVELDYDHAWRSGGNGNMLTANAIGQYRIPNSTVTPYVMAGAGVAYDSLGLARNGSGTGIYDLGAGVRVAVSQSVELDARYRLVRSFENKGVSQREQNLFTVGASYRF